ncbi:MAG: hypothetical protein M1825_000341 [Sarcosagium campestre]|nr:MAG: hypothetical protein M1825_000341 [Sarcosagium campestre]
MADLTQLVISLALGIFAFIAFCILRPRWTGLYAARKQYKDAAHGLPEMPKTFFGWIPVLYNISEVEVLKSSGLDAFVFLAFFRVAIKVLLGAFFLVLVVRTPVHYSIYHEFPMPPPSTNKSDPNTASQGLSIQDGHLVEYGASVNKGNSSGSVPDSVHAPIEFYYMHLIFVYLLSGFICYLFTAETKKIIKVRQEYLGTKSTITDRTIRLSGIPQELRSEDKIKGFVEDLGIGSVEHVTLCKDWKELDQLLRDREATLRKLEEAWTVHRGRKIERSRESLPLVQPTPSEDESAGLLESDGHDRSHVTPYSRARPTTKLRYGPFKLQSKEVDAIDYYEEKLRRLDESIVNSRQKEFTPTAIAFVTMDSIASCQMAIQAVLDPSPMRLQTQLAPAPTDIVWTNTYLSRSNRMTRAWSITFVILLMSVLWTFIIVPLGVLVQLDSIREAAPSFVEFLDRHPILRSLVDTGLPTAVVSLLNVSVPYLYDWLSNMQGMMSQAEVEMSVISKNFFFTFFNLFLVLTILGTSLNQWVQLAGKSFNGIAGQLAQSLESYGEFYANLVILQGLGLFPFKLLEFGSVALYPINLMGAKTPRDYAELVQPPMFRYGFYVPQTLLIFIVCVVYSLLDTGIYILFFGILYFMIGYYVYKYQLLYAMDHIQHSTGRAWPIICYRSFLGVCVFQISMAGWMALRTKKVRPSILVVPLIVATIWFGRYYGRTYEPLLEFIALRSIRHDDNPELNLAGETMTDSLSELPHRSEGRAVNGQTPDEERDQSLRFINPSLISPLEGVWLSNKADGTRNDEQEEIV